jgi:hypothetical protein
MSLKQLLLLFAMLPACGPLAASTSAVTGAATRGGQTPAELWTEVAVPRSDLVATPINGGINPTFFGYRLDAHVMIGSNPCEARGIHARLAKQKEGDVIYVIPQITVSPLEGRICTREFNPQYEDVSLEIRADHTRVSAIRVRNVDEIGRTVAIEELGSMTVEMTVKGVEFVPVNGGINPDAFGVQVQAQVEIGANKCTAVGVRAWFQETTEGREIHVKALRDETANLGRICTKEYRPVYTKLTTVIRGSHSKIDRIVVHNAEGRGKTAVYELN